jgi:hypothetical protein
MGTRFSTSSDLKPDSTFQDLSSDKATKTAWYIDRFPCLIGSFSQLTRVFPFSSAPLPTSPDPVLPRQTPAQILKKASKSLQATPPPHSPQPKPSKLLARLRSRLKVCHPIESALYADIPVTNSPSYMSLPLFPSCRRPTSRSLPASIRPSITGFSTRS